MFKLPFGTLPGHWGLKGKTREIAKAEYELEGYDLEVRLHDLKKDDMDFDEWQRKRWDIEVKHGRMSTAIYERMLITQIKDDLQRSIAELEQDKKEGKVGELDYSKRLATLKKEPWVTVINMDFSRGTSLEGSFELDWNEFFVEKLKAEGYNAINPEATVNMWFMELCRNVALEEFDGTGNFTADSEANLETFKRWHSGAENLDKGRKGYR
jgi:hypothetical protein